MKLPVASFTPRDFRSIVEGSEYQPNGVCGHRDGFDTRPPPPKREGQEKKRIGNLVDLTRRSHSANPSRPAPWLDDDPTNMELQHFSDSESGEGDPQTLEFKADS